MTAGVPDDDDALVLVDVAGDLEDVGTSSLVDLQVGLPEHVRVRITIERHAHGDRLATPAESVDDLEPAGFDKQRLLETRRPCRQDHASIELHRRSERLHPEDVQLVSGSEASDDRGQLTQAEKADLSGSSRTAARA